MIFPNGRRTNARYRGPMESRKVDDLYVDVKVNINTLKSVLDNLENRLTSIKDEASSVKTTVSKNKINVLFDKLELIKEAE